LEKIKVEQETLKPGRTQTINSEAKKPGPPGFVASELIMSCRAAAKPRQLLILL
jgi:hypothetical protein